MSYNIYGEMIYDGHTDFDLDFVIMIIIIGLKSITGIVSMLLTDIRSEQ